MEETRLSIIFKCIVDSACRFRQADANFDGLSYWKHIKSILVVLDARKGRDDWVLDSRIQEAFLNTLGPIDLLYDPTTHIRNPDFPVYKHFLGQHVWLLKGKPTVRKIVQVALNIGQFLGSDEWSLIDEADYIANHLACLHTYVSERDECALSLYITDDMCKQVQRFF